MKFIHTADLHLGYKISSEYSENTFSVLEDNQKKTLSSIIDTGTEERIDALFICGDLFDTPKVNKSLFNFVKSEFERAPFKIFIIAGNHDPKTSDGVYNNERFSDNVYIYPSTMSKVSFMDCDIYGLSFNSPHKLENSLKDFTPDDMQRINIMLAHGDILKDSYYNPMTLEDIKESKLDYLALGHIHLNGEIKKTGNTYYGYSGTPQATSFKETEETFVFLGEVEKGYVKTEKRYVNHHCFKELTVNFDLLSSDDEIISSVRKAISEFNLSKTLFNVTLDGYIKDGFLYDEEYVLCELSNNLLHIRINNNLRVKYDIELLKNEESIRGEFVRNALKMLEGKDYKHILKVIEYGVSRLW